MILSALLVRPCETCSWPIDGPGLVDFHSYLNFCPEFLPCLVSGLGASSLQPDLTGSLERLVQGANPFSVAGRLPFREPKSSHVQSATWCLFAARASTATPMHIGCF